MTYEIIYSTILYAHFYIDAKDEQEAIDKSGTLLNDDTFVENHLIPALDNPDQWGDAIHDCGVDIYPSDCEPTLDVTMFG